MASSNRHWPSLFKSKPCSTHHHHQWQHDMNHSSLLAAGACQKPSYSSSGVAEERSPEPKPRWNPKPEQIRILEAIFNSGMVNPPRDEIRKIRAQLQEYGQVGDANVFYWFQNRKSRSKHKQRHLQSARSQARSSTSAAASSTAHSAAAAIATSVAGPNSSSSSSSGSAGSDKFLPLVSVGPGGMIEAQVSGPTTAVSVNETTPFHGQTTPTEFLVEPFYLQGPHAFSFSSAITGYPEPFGVSMGTPATIWSELMLGQERGSKMNAGGVTEEPKAYNKLHDFNPSFVAGGLVPAASGGGGGAVTSPATATAAASVCFPAGPISETQAEASTTGIGGDGGAARSIVFINEVAFEVVAGPLNIREAFGEEAILIHSSGHAVLTDQWGLTLHPLQHGASYYLV